MKGSGKDNRRRGVSWLKRARTWSLGYLRCCGLLWSWALTGWLWGGYTWDFERHWETQEQDIEAKGPIRSWGTLDANTRPRELDYAHLKWVWLRTDCSGWEETTANVVDRPWAGYERRLRPRNGWRRCGEREGEGGKTRKKVTNLRHVYYSHVKLRRSHGPPHHPKSENNEFDLLTSKFCMEWTRHKHERLAWD